MIRTRICTATLTLLVGATLGTSSAASAAGVYKWQDADGKTHFSDRPPPDSAAETVRAPAAAGTDNPEEQLEALRKRAAAEFEARMEKRTEAQEARAEAEKVAAHCRDTRAKLERLQSSTRNQVINEAGEVEFLVEEKRQAWMQQARDELAEHCR